MRVLMLGWEFPPHISGGLGTACHGLTRAMAKRKVDIMFLLPMASGASSSDVPGGVTQRAGGRTPTEHLSFETVPAQWFNPYASTPRSTHNSPAQADRAARLLAERDGLWLLGTGDVGGYDGDLIGRIEHYAERCLELTEGLTFDVIHAHDWVTYPAAMAIARETGKPLVCHLHACEFDRSGESINVPVYQIERQGMQTASAVITVSSRTRRTILDRYGIPQDRVRVVYNGIEPKEAPAARPARAEGRRTVLFLGRVTMQKGPEFFIRAAQRILESREDVEFIVAGWGDLAPRMIDWVAQMGLSRSIRFSGFLRGEEVAKAYDRADVYVMPSVSEPFGLTALEAIQHGVPVVLSTSSGAAEVLPTGALTVDFWDVDQMVDKILSLLARPALAATLRSRAFTELEALTWDRAAAGCLDVYEQCMTAHETFSVQSDVPTPVAS